MAVPLRTGMLGCGGIGNRHARILAGLEEVSLVAFCDQELLRAEDYNGRYAQSAARVYEDHHRMLDDANLDLLYICLPPFAHTDEVMQAAQRGVHVFIEKPIALESQVAWSMVQAVEAAEIKTQVGFMSRFGDATEHLVRALHSGEAGPVSLLVGKYFCNSLHAPWWRDRSKSGGQAVEQVIHLFDLARYLLGQPRTVYARMDNLFHRTVPGYTSEDISSTTISFDSGALATIVATNTAIPGEWLSEFEVVTRNCTASFEDANHATFTRTDRPYTVTETIASERDTFLAETLDLIGAIRDDRPTRTPMREGALSLDLVLAVAHAARETREIVLPTARSE